MLRLHLLGGAALLAFAVPAGVVAQASGTGLALRAEHRARVEHLAPDFRAGVDDAGARDASGGSGRFLGQQIEARARVRTPVQGLSADLGGVALVPGGFAREAGAMQGTTPYLYTQVTLSRARS